jgi:diadenosine tetraphosphate (Ap4A) HIT family hydrolase
MYVDINNVRSETMRKKWQQIIDDGVNPFDPQHVEKYIDGEIIKKGTHWYVFQNDQPYPGVKYQFVIVSNEFKSSFTELTHEEMIEFYTIAEILTKEYEIPGGGLIMRFGDTNVSGGSVKHLHGQLLVPNDGEKVAAWFGSEKK